MNSKIQKGLGNASCNRSNQFFIKSTCLDSLFLILITLYDLSIMHWCHFVTTIFRAYLSFYKNRLGSVNMYITIFHVFISGFFFQFLGTSLSLFEWCMCMTKDITCIVYVTHRTCVCCDDIYERRNPMWYRRFMIIII